MRKILYFGLLLLFSSCLASKQKKSAGYYYENEKNIREIIKLFEELYRTQPFSLGFSDRSYEHIGMDIMTDTVRYALNNETSQKPFFYAVETFKYDTVKLRNLFIKMKEIKCIWVGKESIYYKGKEEKVVFLSFKSVKFGNPLLDTKYYMLVLFDPGFINLETEAVIAKQGWKKVNKSVYFTITGSFR